MAIFELSNKKYKNGRRPFTAILYELQPPDSVIDDVGTKYNKNGITFLEEYASKQLDSIKDMSVTVSFIDEDRTMISDHGDTGVEDGLPVFDNATTVGHFTKGYIDNVEINGETKRCVLGKGFIDEMRYKPFVETLESEIHNGNSVDGSIEIYRSEGNENIVYKKGWIPEGRIPTEYIHSGWAMVLNPADVNSTLLELNSKKQNKEEIVMNEKEMRELITSVITETNSKNDELTKTINELNSTVADKDTQIADLNAKVEANATADADKDAKIEELNNKIAELEAKLDECKKAEQNSALDKALEAFTETEQKYAESEINAFRENPITGNVDVVVNAINAGIGKAVKAAEAKVAEQNSAKEDADLDIFSEVNSVKDVDDSDVNIF
jgi:uncharacterized coiled-coil protein SlyX